MKGSKLKQTVIKQSYLLPLLLMVVLLAGCKTSKPNSVLLHFVIPTREAAVQAVPNTTSIMPKGLKQFAIKQPSTRPGAYFLSINAISISTSEIRI